MFRFVPLSIALAAAAIAVSPASAETLTCTSSESLLTASPGGTAATNCQGWFTGNVLDNSSADVATQTTALAALGVTFTDFNNYTKLDNLNGTSTLDFGTTLLGPTVIGIHFGNGSGVGNSTGFFLFNFTQPTSSINLGIGSSSDAVLYASGGAVPEPATWAMMLLGFAGIGFAIRRRRQVKPLQIA
jgi:PEP-CTERM motif